MPRPARNHAGANATIEVLLRGKADETVQNIFVMGTENYSAAVGRTSRCMDDTSGYSAILVNTGPMPRLRALLDVRVRP
jgi:hypothetical protein